MTHMTSAVKNPMVVVQVIALVAMLGSSTLVSAQGGNETGSELACRTRRFLESRGYTTPFPTGTWTWRGGGLLMHADWIFSRGLKILRCGVAKPLKVSDHWPIWAEIEPGA